MKKNRKMGLVQKNEKGKRREHGIRRAGAFFLCMAVTIIYTACGADSATVSSMMKNEGGSFYTAENDFYTVDSTQMEEVALENTAGMSSAGILDGRKLIENVNLEVETREYERMMSVLEEQIQSMNGYIESMDSYNGSRYSGNRSLRYANLTIRIPSGNLNRFLITVSDTGNVVRSNKSVDDVTLSYVDMASRRDTLQKEQERLISFLDRAETIEEIITVEERLSEVRYQLESMESQLRTIDNLVDYSTVHLHISEVEELTPVEEPSVWERISGGFMESLHNVGNGAREFGIWFLVHIPYLVIWGALITAIVVFCIRHHRRKLKKLESRLWKPAGAQKEAEEPSESQKDLEQKKSDGVLK